MTEPEGEPKTECDPADIVCQLQVLEHLKGLKGILTEDRFKNSYPELVGLEERISDRIKERGSSINEALNRCSLPLLGELFPDTDLDVLTPGADFGELNLETESEEE